MGESLERSMHRGKVGKPRDTRSAWEVEKERMREPFLILKGHIPDVLYRAMMYVFVFVKALLARTRPDAYDVAVDLANDFRKKQDDRKLADILGLSDAGLRSFCYKASEYAVINHLNDPRQRLHTQLPDDDDAPGGKAQGASVDRLFEVEGLAQDIERAIRRLSPNEEKVIRLRWKEELTFEEIGRNLGMKPATARVHARNAYEKMRPVLEHLRTAYGRSGHESTLTMATKRRGEDSDE